MELLTKGISLPPLGSPISTVWNGFMLKERNRRICFAKLLVQSMVSTSEGGKVSDIKDALSKYVDAEIRLTDVYENTDMIMREEYESIRNLAPKAQVDVEGNLVVTGILGEETNGVQR